jgi:hypothetical protein
VEFSEDSADDDPLMHIHDKEILQSLGEPIGFGVVENTDFQV